MLSTRIRGQGNWPNLVRGRIVRHEWTQMSTGDASFGPGGSVEPGTELGGYRIDGLLGRGGMGIVYRARDLALERNVALKLLAPELAEDVHFRERFHRESRLAASLDHPSIVPVYDAGEVAGRLYIAMRLVDGTDLKRLLAEEGPLEPHRALAILGQVADALDTAHERGLVHRDVKPSNVLIDGREHVYLADFGLSRLVTETGTGIGDGQTLGTVGYVSPEQIRGDELDGRSDLYSLGCMLYECLAGHPPFTGSDTAVVFAHLQQAPPSLAGPDPIIGKALAKDPEERFQSGRELVDNARRALGATGPRRMGWPLAIAVIGFVLAGAALAVALTQGGDGSGTRAKPGVDTLLTIDPTQNRVTKAIPVGRGASAVAASGGRVWVANFVDGTVSRIDAATGDTLDIPVQGSPTGVAAAGDDILVANGPEHSLVSIDGATGSVRFVTPLKGDASGTVSVASGDGSPRFADAANQLIGQVDLDVKGTGLFDPITIPNSGDGTSFDTMYDAFGGLAIDTPAPHSVWVAGDPFARSLFRTYPGTEEREIDVVHLPFAPGMIAAGEHSVWVASLLADEVWRLDPFTERLVARVRVGGPVSGIAVGGGAAWVTSARARTVYRIDLGTNRVVARIPTEGAPGPLAVGAGGVYVASRAPAPLIPPDAIGIGVLADCRGPFGAWYEQSLAGAELPLLHRGSARAGTRITDGVRGAHVAGRSVILSLGCTDGTAASALAEARRLVDENGVRIVIGPTTAPEQIALQEYARERPQVTFVNGSAGAQLLDPPPNMFSFHLDLAQSVAGLGTYAYRQLGWRRAVLVADESDREVNWTQAAGFVAEFCALGGKIAKRVWVPPGTDNYAGVVTAIPRQGVDGIFAAASPQTVEAVGGPDGPLRGQSNGKLLVGILATSGLEALGAKNVPVAVPYLSVGERRYWYGVDLGTRFPAQYQYLGAFDIWYHDAMKAALTGLAQVDGDLSDGGRALLEALSRLTLESPLGRIRLDGARQAIGTNSLVRFPDGTVIRRVPGVDHTFGGYFSAGDPAPSQSTPACGRRRPPAWAR